MTVRRHMSRVGFGALLGMVGFAGSGVAVCTAAAAQELPAVGFAAFSRAQAVRTTFGAPGFLIVDDYVDGGGPIAQARMDSAGVSQAFGSVAYPGETAIAGPGTLAGLGAPRLPDYPFYVQAEHPFAPENRMSEPSGQVAMAASAGPDSAAGSAQSLLGSAKAVSSGARSEAAATVANGIITSRAASETHMLSFGEGVLTVNAVRSRSETVAGLTDAAPTTKTALDITGAKVAGQAVVIGPDGVALAGQPAPGTGQKTPEDLLAQAGIEVSVVKGESVTGGSTADILRVVLNGGPPGSGSPRGQVVLDFGGATSSIRLGASAMGEGQEDGSDTGVPAAPHTANFVWRRGTGGPG